METAGLYIHIPFCRRKCYYCDFVSYPAMEDVLDRYIDALAAEARMYSGYLKHRVIDTIFIGGGTPSLLSPEQMDRLMRALRNACRCEAKEVTAEANPETLTREKIAAYASSGVNRLSIGLQTHENGVLARIGRRHTYEMFAEMYAAASPFFRINADVMFGLPGQSVEGFAGTLERLKGLAVPHISAYALKLEPGTRLADTFAGADEDTDRQMYHLAADLLGSAGYVQYETSNFAKPGHECLHNLKYWTGGEYLGLGVAAHSYLTSRGKKRFCNTDSLRDYLKMTGDHQKPVVHMETLSPADERTEYIMLRLRLKEGILFSDYNRRFGDDFQKQFAATVAWAAQAGLIIEHAYGICPTLKGFDLQNTLISEFMKKI